MTPLLARISDELLRVHQAHTILLYGSRANGTQGPHSDHDIAAFAAVARIHRDTRLVDGEYLDVFVYPEAALDAPGEEHLKLRGAVVIAQRADDATRFLAGLEALHQRGPTPLPPDEIAVRRSWAWKMNARLRRGDVEGNFRRVWLLTALLEDYFHLRGLWFEGPKRALLWLGEHDPVAHAAFERALTPGAPATAIEALVTIVAGKPG
jgi:predicted nucleotidyltransferase